MEIDRLLASNDIEGVTRRVDADDAMTEILEHFRGRHRDQRIVVDEQDDGGSTGPLLHRHRLLRFRKLGGDREDQGRCSANSDLTGELKGTAELHGKTMHHREAKSGSFAKGLGGKERLHGPLQRL
ncbi:hypothetical protein ACQ86E_17060 [Bradyrhizobium betae]|uniref:hypothetical protein n=1 Tax=Bradyrhizobium betae TaxID=244734 RepID=UPI003D67FBA8